MSSQQWQNYPGQTEGMRVKASNILNYFMAGISEVPLHAQMLHKSLLTCSHCSYIE